MRHAASAVDRGWCMPAWLPVCLPHGHWPASGLARDAPAKEAPAWLLHCAMAAYEAAHGHGPHDNSHAFSAAAAASVALPRIASLRRRLALAAPDSLIRLDCLGEAAVILWEIPSSGQ
ncbi:hypothetical protein J3F83DRAFT_74658 [Trichoderma novae-zelandiae]